MKRLVLVGILSSFLLLTACGNKATVANVDLEKATALAECLDDNGWMMYGSATCPHCKNQRALFGDAFDEIDYVDCVFDSKKCQIAGISGVPVWRGPEGIEIEGSQQLATLAERAGCEWNE